MKDTGYNLAELTQLRVLHEAVQRLYEKGFIGLHLCDQIMQSIDRVIAQEMGEHSVIHAPDCACKPDPSTTGDWADHEQWCPYSIWVLRQLYEKDSDWNATQD